MRQKPRTVRRFTSSIRSPKRRPPLWRRSRRANAVIATARLLQLGRRSYYEVLELQREVHARVASGEDPDTWLVVEHEPVITLGRNGKRENLLLAPETLAARGIDVVPVERGGDATYHGPGQLVVYPVVKLARFREIVPFVTSLESAVIAALATLGIEARAKKEHRGVYVGGDAICSIGLAVKQMTVLHGMALNVSTVLDYDRLITPCGMRDFGITSVSHVLGREIGLEEARTVLLPEFEYHFKVTFETQSCDYYAV